MEDLLEELVGEIKDEYDKAERSGIINRSDGSWLVNGLEAIDKVCERVGLPPPSETDLNTFTTLAGLILTRLDRIADVGDTLILGDFILEVSEMDGRRISKVVVRRTESRQQTIAHPEESKSE
jgi:CBS domain containing-hemolysin-like protein